MNSQLKDGANDYEELQKGSHPVPSYKDNDLDTKRHQRTYNPVDEAKRTTVSQALNEDAGRARSGPGSY